MPLVSIIILYDKNRFSKTLKSICSGSYSNVEILVGVNNSDEDKIVHHAFNNSNLNHFSHIINNQLLVPEKYNFLASKATGKYLLFLYAGCILYPFGIEQMTYEMEINPSAALGLSCTAANMGMTYPKLLNSEETYKRHFYEHPVFFRSISDCIIKRDIFLENEGLVNQPDFYQIEIFCRLSRSYPTLIMTYGKVWHNKEVQHWLQNFKKEGIQKFKHQKYLLDIITNENSPLNTEEVKNIKQLITQSMYMDIARSFLKGHLNTSSRLRNEIKLPFITFLNTMIILFYQKIFRSRKTLYIFEE